MQVVINITDSFYDRLIHMDSDNDTCSFNESALVEAIQKGKQLPKGHERLIDANEVVLLYDLYRKGNALKGDDDAFLNAIRRAQTIIEADVPKRRKGTPLEENDSGYNCENWIP